jgi:uncharacterized protein (DUF1015 family)
MSTAPDATSEVGVRPAPLYLADQALAPRVAAPPHDARTLRAMPADADPLSYLNVLEMREGDGVDLRVALRANRQALRRLLRANVFHASAAPRFAWYRLGVSGHEQTALVAEVAIADYDRGRIIPHEHTQADREEHLAAHLEVTGATSTPVALAHPPDDQLRALRRKETERSPQVRFTADDGVEHTIWTTEHPRLIADIQAVARGLGRLYITDGHHRFAAAARVAAARVAARGVVRADPDAPDQWVLAALFPADELRILPFHRAVLRPPGVEPDELLARLADHVTVRPLPDPVEPDSVHRYVAYVDGRWYGLSTSTPTDGPLDRLDVVALQDQILAPVFGVNQPRLDPRLHYVAGGPTELRAHCDQENAVGFLVRATTMDQLMAVADAGLVMPPKSTRFDPKPRAGLFLRLIA